MNSGPTFRNKLRLYKGLVLESNNEKVVLAQYTSQSIPFSEVIPDMARVSELKKKKKRGRIQTCNPGRICFHRLYNWSRGTPKKIHSIRNRVAMEIIKNIKLHTSTL